MKNILIFLVVVLVIGFGVASYMDTPTEHTDELSVVTSFYPLYFFASEIGGEYADIHNVVPAGAEPHEYEPTPRDIITMEKSDVLILNGGGFEPWEHDVLENLSADEIVIVLAGEDFMTREFEEEEHHEDEMHEHEEDHDEHEDHDHEDEHEEEEHHHEGLDPHVWLSPEKAMLMVEEIVKGFVLADPAHESIYRENASALIAKLQTLDADYRNALSVCTSRTIVTSHDAFWYLAEAYELEQLPISGLSPEAEPSAADLAEISTFAEEHGVTHVFFETLVSPRLAETLAQEIGAETLVLNPLGGLTAEEQDHGETYFTVMYANLDSLTEALGCTL
ncbi:zinc ABC transporter substrate-binding protein [Candidatus Kaiserbacteria bacterium]|nr:zinc ABC transporter substrate-binding protein [Candidatus Kaiserbacteria bacterium]